MRPILAPVRPRHDGGFGVRLPGSYRVHGSESTRLVVLRGPSGAGKTSTALALRERLGRGVALVQQDVFRRLVLREHDVPGGANIGLIGVTARYALDHGFDVIVEGIMSAQRYRDMLAELARGHRGTSTFFYFDVSFDETVQRHATRPQSADFTSEEMRGWYRPDDRLGILGEHVLPQHLSLQAAVDEVHNLGFCSNA